MIINDVNGKNYNFEIGFSIFVIFLDILILLFF